MAKAVKEVSIDEIIKKLKNNEPSPVYILHGEEPYYIDEISDYIETHLLSETEKSFNQTILYGKEVDVYSIINAARRYPMMSERQLVMVKEAQNLKEVEKLLPYLENPLASTIFVLCYKYKKMDGRSKMLKLAKEKYVVFESTPIPDYKLLAWIENYCKSKKILIQPLACSMLTDFLGNDLSKIVNEIDKVLINIKDHHEITSQHIEKYVGISREFNTFELQNAIGAGNFFKAQKIIQYFASNPKENSIIPVLSSLYNFFGKLLAIHNSKDYSENNIAKVAGVHPFFVKEYIKASQQYPLEKCIRIIGYIHEFDLKSKGIGSTDISDGSLLKELVFMIMKL
ncbi:MAG: DNA polymerase III subunit delta [Bacteroidetes bacterium]|nr:DNA polymerase III subunit delta [Bacteroidota bacterium]